MKKIRGTFLSIPVLLLANAPALWKLIDINPLLKTLIIVEQKRIEFWGEGIIFWDYKRLELQVVRGYPGTNAPIGYRFNSIEGYCAPWMNIFISLYENVFNKGAVLNPDPSQAIKEWVE